jgi:hypothetical protein
MIGDDPAAFLAQLTEGVISLGKVTRRQQRYLD